MLPKDVSNVSNFFLENKFPYFIYKKKKIFLTQYFSVGTNLILFPAKRKEKPEHTFTLFFP